MKKHIIGLTLFSLIVSAAAIVYTVFSIYPKYWIKETPSNSTSKASSLWKIKDEQSDSSINAVRVEQVVYESMMKSVRFKLAAPDNAQVVLHFFVKGENGTQYLTSLFVLNTPILKGAKTDKYLKNFESTENLYVMAELTDWNKYQEGNTYPTFNINQAAPVLIANGE